MSLDSVGNILGDIGTIGVFVAIILWFRKDLTEHFNRDIEHLKNTVVSHEKQDAEMWQRITVALEKHDKHLEGVLTKMLETDLDLGSRIAWLEGRYDLRPRK